MAGTINEATSGASGVLGGLGTLTKVFAGVAGASLLVVGLGALTGDLGVGMNAADVSNAGTAIAGAGANGEVALGVGFGDYFSILGQSIGNIGNALAGLTSLGPAPTVV